MRYDRSTDAVQIMGIYVRNNQECVVMSDSYYPDGVIGFVDMLKPIPLTAEILEKNGFVEDVPKGEAYKLGINDDVWLFRNDGCWDFRIYYNFYSAGIILTQLRIKHTHQLQHALRLAGVEKEIEI